MWLFSSGPLSNAADALAEAAPREVAAIERDLEARGHTVFAGAWQRDARPIGFLETVMRAFPAAREALPAADYRDWPAVDAFATNVAGELEPRARDGLRPHSSSRPSARHDRPNGPRPCPSCARTMDSDRWSPPRSPAGAGSGG